MPSTGFAASYILLWSGLRLIYLRWYGDGDLLFTACSFASKRIGLQYIVCDVFVLIVLYESSTQLLTKHENLSVEDIVNGLFGILK